MAAPRKIDQTPEQAERQARFEEAMRWAGKTWTAFAEEHGFTLESIWRWVRDGDPKREPRNGGRVHSAREFAKSLDVAVGYFQLGGLRFQPPRAEPFRAEGKVA